MTTTLGEVEIQIRNKLHSVLEATHMEIVNESHLHGEEYGAETHFRVVVVSRKFQDMSSLKRHRLVNDALREQIRGGVRALSIVAKTPEQWEMQAAAAGDDSKRRASFGISQFGSEEVTRWP